MIFDNRLLFRQIQNYAFLRGDIVNCWNFSSLYPPHLSLLIQNRKVRLFFVLQTTYKASTKQAKRRMSIKYLRYLAFLPIFGLLCYCLSFLCCNFVARKETCNICNKLAIWKTEAASHWDSAPCQVAGLRSTSTSSATADERSSR